MLYNTSHLTKKQLEVKEAAENDFFLFCKIVDPTRCLGHIHEDVCNWLQEKYSQGSTHQLVLLPRAHLKSTLIALFAAWVVVKKPWITVLYASASGDLAERQLRAICGVLTGPDVCLYWPGLIKTRISERDKWRSKAFNVDHPIRKEKRVRDDTMRALSIGAGVTGDHYDIVILDDIIAPNTDADPWTGTGRDMANRWYAQLSSVLNPGGSIFAVGTRYHKRDIYNVMMEEEIFHYDRKGNVTKKDKQFSIMEEVAERNDQYLWPRQQATDGEWYGFNRDVLNKIKETYRKSGQMEQFFAQYYQNPSDEENPKIKTSFLYYDPEILSWGNNRWNLDGGAGRRPLNVFAAMDLAFTTNKTSDYSVVIVEGIDEQGFRYVLDIIRYRTSDPKESMLELFGAAEKWKFKKVRIEATGAQVYFIKTIKQAMMGRNQFFVIEEYKPQIKKEERIMSTLSPLYELGVIRHFRGGLCEELEQQLVQQKPEYDDIADAHAAIQDIMYKPANAKSKQPAKIEYNSKFGGVTGVQYAS